MPYLHLLKTLNTATNVFPMAFVPPTGGQNCAQVLDDHDHINRSMAIPLFYGHKDKDTFTACLLIERINNAATIAGWLSTARSSNSRCASETKLSAGENLSKRTTLIWLTGMSSKEKSWRPTSQNIRLKQPLQLCRPHPNM